MNSVSHFTIKTESFEGPLDLLLSLVEKRKLFINEISLAEVTNDYIDYVQHLPEYSLDARADFIVIASTLILIKSKSLLPTLELTEEEEQAVGDLEDRLSKYQQLKKQSLLISKLYRKSTAYQRIQASWEIPVFIPTENLTKDFLKNTLNTFLATFPKLEKLPEVIVQKIKSIEEVMEDLGRRIQSSLKSSFREITNTVITNKEEKINVIVTFLAMLELVKQGIIEVRQHSHFEDIEIETETIGIPRYTDL